MQKERRRMGILDKVKDGWVSDKCNDIVMNG
jgi:hypothetical protein